MKPPEPLAIGVIPPVIPMTAHSAELRTGLDAREIEGAQDQNLRFQLGIKASKPVKLDAIPGVREAVNATSGDAIKTFHLKAWGSSWAAAVSFFKRNSK